MEAGVRGGGRAWSRACAKAGVHGAGRAWSRACVEHGIVIVCPASLPVTMCRDTGCISNHALRTQTNTHTHTQTHTEQAAASQK